MISLVILLMVGMGQKSDAGDYSKAWANIDSDYAKTIRDGGEPETGWVWQRDEQGNLTMKVYYRWNRHDTDLSKCKVSKDKGYVILECPVTAYPQK